MTLLLDNTVLSNFALTRRMDLVRIALGNNIATTTAVLDEFQAGTIRGLLPQTDLTWLTIIELSAAEQVLFQELLVRVNAGEAACLAAAAHRSGRLFTDDRDARTLAARLQIPVSGTLGILHRLIQIQVLTLSEANALLGEMISQGYRSPVANLADL